MSKHIGIIGARVRGSHEDYQLVAAKFFELYEPGDFIVSGGCSAGADSFAEHIAKHHGIPIIIFYADWKGKGKSAGMRRNKLLVDRAEYLIALDHPDSKGTKHAINYFRDTHSNDERLYLL